MQRRIASGRRRGGEEEPIDMFPFLSLLLCVVGVLAFIQVLMTATLKPAFRMRGDVHEGYKHAYQIICHADGFKLVPPLPSLGRDLQARLPPEQQVSLHRLFRQRCSELASLIKDPDAISTRSDQAVASELARIVELNGLMTAAHLPYEEFLLVGIRPGGGAQFHRLRALLNRSEFTNLAVGLQPLSVQQRPELQPCPEKL